MTKSQALLILNNPDTYPAKKVRDAAVYLLGSISLTDEEFDLGARFARYTRKD